MSIQRINPEQRLCDATIHNGVAYFAGQVPEDPRQPIREQTHSVLRQIDALLQRVGSDRTRVLSATIYLASMGDYAALNEVWDGWIGTGGQGPARATVEARLATPEYRVEIQIIAACA